MNWLVIAALTFSLTVNRFGSAVMLRYPEAKGLSWVEVCVEQEGTDSKDRPFYKQSCWEPRFKVEEVRLLPGALRVRAHLEVSEDSVHSFLHTPVIQVRPEPEEN